MKKIKAIVIVLFAGLLSFSSASAQKFAAEVEIPFSFTAGNTRMPSGVYLLNAEGNHTSINNRKAFWGAYIIPNVPASYTQIEKVRLVFATYGDQYFLREIQDVSGDVRYKVPISKAERNAKKSSPTYLGN